MTVILEDEVMAEHNEDTSLISASRTLISAITKVYYLIFLLFIFPFLFFVCFVGSLGEGGQTCPLKVCNLIFLTCSLCMFSSIFFVDSFYPNALFFFMSYSNKTNDSQVYCYSNSCM